MFSSQGPPLPGLTPSGMRVIVMRATKKDFETPNIADAMKLALMIGDIRLAAEEVGVAGDVYILDASVASVNHLAKITPTIVKKFLVCVQEAYPVKVKEVHVINASPIVDTIISWVKPFLKEKIRNRIHIHTEIDTLYDFVPKDILPEEYGGSGGKMDTFNGKYFLYRSGFFSDIMLICTTLTLFLPFFNISYYFLSLHPNLYYFYLYYYISYLVFIVYLLLDLFSTSFLFFFNISLY